MKRIFSVLIITAMLLSALPLSAFSQQYPPSSALISVKPNGEDTVFSFSLSADSFILEMEQERLAALEECLNKGLSGAQIHHSVRFPLELTVKCTASNGEVGFSKLLSLDTKSTDVSLFRDIMPSFVKKDGDIGDTLLNGFSFTLSVCYTHFNGTRRDELTEYGESKVSQSFTVPELYYIGYVLPKDAVNSPNNVSFGTAPLLAPIRPDAPTRSGYTFSGWTLPDGSYTGTVNADTKKVILTAAWDSKPYAIRYILTTSAGYNFIKVDNSANPVTYVSQVGATLTSPAVPKGWHFLGWTDSDGNLVTEIPKGTLGDVVVYAVWLNDDEYIDKLIADYHWCDVDTDGKITVNDARTVLRASVGFTRLTQEMLKRVDFVGQGRADVTQARLILRVAVGMTTVRKILEYYEIDPERNMR